MPTARQFLIAAGIASMLSGCGDSTAPATTGSMEVIVTMSGSQAELANLEITLDRQAPEPLVGDRMVINGLAPGRHSVALGGVVWPCGVTTPNPTSVDITAGASTSAAFAVDCPQPATVVVAVSTTVINAPGGGTYLVVFDRTRFQTVNSTGTVTFETVSGQHSVELRNVPGYCSVGGFTPQPNPTPVTLRAGQIKTVRFGVLCIG